MEQRQDEASGGTRHGLRFYGRCAHEAWRRSWDAATAAPPILGLLVVYGVVRAAGYDPGLPADVPYGTAIGAGLFVGVAWLTVFLFQFVAAPPRLHARQEAELRALRARRPGPAQVAAPKPLALEPPKPAPEAAVDAALPGPAAAMPLLLLPTPAAPPPRVEEPVVRFEPEPEPDPEPVSLPMPGPAPRPALPALDVRLHDQVYETDAVDTVGELLPAARAYVARVTNRGNKRIRRCQLFLGSPTHIQVVSGPFDLAPGEQRDLPVLRVIDESDEPHALLYFLDSETWAVAQGQAAWLPEPGRFKVKVLSANAPDAALDVMLARSAGTPYAWTLIEAAAEMDEAPVAPARRGRAKWTAADVVAEPSSGDD